MVTEEFLLDSSLTGRWQQHDELWADAPCEVEGCRHPRVVTVETEGASGGRPVWVSLCATHLRPPLWRWNASHRQALREVVPYASASREP